MPMKRLQFIPVCLLWGWLISLGVFGLCGPLQGASREADWKKVDEAVQKGLPKTAIEALEPIKVKGKTEPIPIYRVTKRE